MSRLSVVKTENGIAPVEIKNAAGEWIAYVRSADDAADMVKAKNILPALVSLTENAVEIIARLDSMAPMPTAGAEFLKTAQAFLAMLRIDSVPTGRTDA